MNSQYWSYRSITCDVTKSSYNGTDHPTQNSGAHPQSSEGFASRSKRCWGQEFGEVLPQDQDLNRQVAIKHYRGDLEMALKACRDELRFLGRRTPQYTDGLSASVSTVTYIDAAARW